MPSLEQASDEGRPDRGAIGSAPRRLGSGLETLAFWGAIVLPALYLPLLLAGLDDAQGLLLFLGLFGLHVVLLYGGRGWSAR